MQKSDSRVALVTGGTSGIGLAIATRFAAEGCHVIAAGVTDPLPSSGDRIHFVRLDVRSQAEIDALFREIPTLDIVVNAAGIVHRRTEWDTVVFEDVINVNLTGAMRVCTTAHPLLVRSRGAVVNIASLLSFFGGPRVPGYTASKGGIAQLTKSMAVAWAAEGIRVNAVAPGWIATDLTKELYQDPVRTAQLMARTPMGRWGQPEDVAGAVSFLCSPDAAFITGAILMVDGGYSAM